MADLGRIIEAAAHEDQFLDGGDDFDSKMVEVGFLDDQAAARLEHAKKVGNGLLLVAKVVQCVAD